MIDANEEQETYRDFRTRLLKYCKLNTTSCGHQVSFDGTIPPHPYGRLRKLIIEFREQVSFRYLRNSDEIGCEHHVRRALGIPLSTSLYPKRWSLLRHIAQIFVPLRFTMRQMHSILLQVRTYEGREYIFNKYFSRMFPLESVRFTAGIDFALRRLDLPSTWEEFQALQRLDPDWIKATYDVGIRNVSDIVPYGQYGHFKLRGYFARILVKEKIVATREELEWLNYKGDDYCRYYIDDVEIYPRAKNLIQLLLSSGIDREYIAGVFRYPLTSFNPPQLITNLSIMHKNGQVDISALFDEAGDMFWRTSPENWFFVLNILGAVSATDVMKFRRLLNSHRTLSVDFAEELKKLGADISGLAQCQSLILTVSGQENSLIPVEQLYMLAAEPHLMSIEQISLCGDYLSEPEKLSDFLTVLTKYGYGAASAILAFQVCYKNSSGDLLDVWLSILDGRGKGQEFEVIADWVAKALRGGHSAGYIYLLGVVPVSDFKQLQQISPVVTLGPSMLTFLVENCGLCSVQALRNWYFHARGIHGLDRWWRIDDVYYLLLEDAFNRNNFSFVKGNRHCIVDAVTTRVRGVLGSRPYRADEEMKASYDKAYEAQSASELQALLPVLPLVLQQTGGILLKSVVGSAWDAPEILNAKLTALTPLINDLLCGKGPSSPVLDALEVDAIALLYRSSIESIGMHWAKLVGYETHLAGMRLRSHYPMVWQGSVRQLKNSLERKSLLAMAAAAAYSTKFRNEEYGDIFVACKHLKARRLYHAASDPWALAAHLGVLLSAAQADSVVAEWISRDLEIVAHMAEEGEQTFERIEQLEKLFYSTLPDALSEHSARFLRQFDDSDAAFLAERLAGNRVCSAGGGAEQLLEGFRLAQETVLTVCQRWIIREKSKFVQDKSGELTTMLSAFLSKHPAAFFAKQTVGLCTRNNTLMWEEPRHAHLVVFNQKQRCVAGMALIYIEPIKALHSDKNCLIIRAINPTDEMLATHTSSSIVDAFFDVAIQIAKDNALAAVAFPYHNGVHLLSNHPAIEKDIDKRYIKPSVRQFYGQPDNEYVEWRIKPRVIGSTFFAYELGDEKVSELYAIWSGEVKEDSAKGALLHRNHVVSDRISEKASERK